MQFLLKIMPTNRLVPLFLWLALPSRKFWICHCYKQSMSIPVPCFRPIYSLRLFHTLSHDKQITPTIPTHGHIWVHSKPDREICYWDEFTPRTECPVFVVFFILGSVSLVRMIEKTTRPWTLQKQNTMNTSGTLWKLTAMYTNLYCFPKSVPG